MPVRVFAYILLLNAQMSFGARLLCFCIQFMLQSSKADGRTILYFERRPAKRIGTDFDSELARLLKSVENPERINSGCGLNFKPNVLDLHTAILFCLSVRLPGQDLMSVARLRDGQCLEISSLSGEWSRLEFFPVLYSGTARSLECVFAVEACAGVPARTWPCRHFFQTRFPPKSALVDGTRHTCESRVNRRLLSWLTSHIKRVAACLMVRESTAALRHTHSGLKGWQPAGSSSKRSDCRLPDMISDDLESQ